MSTGVYVNLIYNNMRNYNFIKEQLIKKHEIIDNEIYLDKYINFLINYNLDINIDYTENHHILPKCVFPEFKNESWNIVKLSYEDHKLVHLWLFKTINIRQYQKPLNWMMNYYKNKLEISKASKRGWINLKNNKEKYAKFCEKRSDYMKTLSSVEQSRRAKIFWNTMTDNEYLKFCHDMKNYWTDEKKIEKSNKMKIFYLNPNNIKKKSIESKNRWDSLSNEECLKFKEKMNIVNKDKTKRKSAGNKIKGLWKDKKYLQKMSNRKHRPGIMLKLINIDNIEIIFENMTTMINKYNFSAHLIRKYRDKNIKISEEHLTKENIILLNCKIESVK